MTQEELRKANEIVAKINQLNEIDNAQALRSNGEFGFLWKEKGMSKSVSFPIEMKEEIVALMNRWKERFEQQLSNL